MKMSGSRLKPRCWPKPDLPQLTLMPSTGKSAADGGCRAKPTRPKHPDLASMEPLFVSGVAGIVQEWRPPLESGLG